MKTFPRVLGLLLLVAVAMPLVAVETIVLEPAGVQVRVPTDQVFNGFFTSIGPSLVLTFEQGGLLPTDDDSKQERWQASLWIRVLGGDDPDWRDSQQATFMAAGDHFGPQWQSMIADASGQMQEGDHFPLLGRDGEDLRPLEAQALRRSRAVTPSGERYEIRKVFVFADHTILLRVRSLKVDPNTISALQETLALISVALDEEEDEDDDEDEP